MTSNHSFLTSMNENLKRRVWAPAMFLALLLIIYPMRTAMILSNQKNWYGYALNLKKDAFTYMGFDALSVVAIGGAAIICAMQGFAWLYDRKKVDMYLSQPVKISRFYKTIYINGILIFFVPYLLAQLLTIILIKAIGGFSSIMVINFFYSLLLQILYFLAVYHITILAMMLCGHLIVAGIATFVFLVYEIVFKGLLCQYFEMLTTYHNTGSTWGNYKYTLSPLAVGFNMVENTRKIWDMQVFSLPAVWENIMKPMLPLAGKLILIAIIACALAYYCYQKRPMEASNVAVAFYRIKPYVKVAALVECGLAGGIIFYQFSNENHLFCILGIACGLFISQCVIEIIYDFDFKSLLHGAAAFGIGTVINVMIYAIFLFDLLGYDHYIPKTEQLQEVAISLQFDNLYRKDYIGEDGHLTWDYDYALNNMHIKDPSVVLELAKNGMYHEKISFNRNERENDSDTVLAVVQYTLQSGRTVYREFPVNYKEQEEVLNYLFKQGEYKEGVDCILSHVTDDFYRESEIEYDNGISTQKVLVQSGMDIMSLYRQDFIDMRFTDVKEAIPCGILRLKHQNKDAYRSVEQIEYPVYRSYERTIAFLEGKNIVLSEYVDPEAVASITITNYDYDTTKQENGAYVGEAVAAEDTFYEDEYPQVTYEDKAQLKQILQHMYSDRLTAWCYLTNQVFTGLDFTMVSAENEASLVYNWYDMYMNIPEKELPDFVIYDLGINQ